MKFHLSLRLKKLRRTSKKLVFKSKTGELALVDESKICSDDDFLRGRRVLKSAMKKTFITLALIASTALAERITFSPSQPTSQVHHYRVYSSPHSATNPAAVWTFRGAFTNPPTVLVTNILNGSVTNRLLIQTNLPLGTISGKVSVVGTNGFESASAKEEILFPVSNLTIEVE